MAYDINRLRQQYTLGGDYGMGDMDYGMGDMGAPPILPSRRPIGSMSGIPDTVSMYPPEYEEQVMDPRAPQAPQVTPVGSSMTTLWDQLNKIYSPETAERQRFSDLLGQFPTREEPNWARKLVAGGIGVGARGTKTDPIEAMEKVMYAPYLRNLGEWSAQVDPRFKAAELENRANINERTLAGNLLTATWQTEKAAEQARYQQERNRIAEEKNEAANRVAQDRVNLERLKLQGWKFDTNGPTVIASHTDANGNPVVRDTGIKTGNMTEADKIALQNLGRVEAAKQTGANQLANIGARGAGIFQAPDGKLYKADENGNLTPVTGGPGGPITRPGTPRAGDTDTPNEAKQRQQNLMRDIWNKYPHMKQYMKKTGDTYSVLSRPEKGMLSPWTSDEDLREYDRMMKMIYPDYVPPTGQQQQQGQQEKQPVKKEYSASRNQTRITYSDGTTQIVSGKQ